MFKTVKSKVRFLVYHFALRVVFSAIVFLIAKTKLDFPITISFWDHV